MTELLSTGFWRLEDRKEIAAWCHQGVTCNYERNDGINSRDLANNHLLGSIATHSCFLKALPYHHAHLYRAHTGTARRS